MGNYLIFHIFIAFFFSISSVYSACTSSIVVNGNTRTYTNCVSFSDWAYLSWSFDPSSLTFDTMYRALLTTSSGWSGWGLNYGPSPTMVGANVLIGFKDSTNTVKLYTYKLTTYSGLPSPGTSDLTLSGSNLVDISGNILTVFAKILIPNNQSTAVNVVLNRGSGTSGSSPLPHSTDAGSLRASTAVVNLATGSKVNAVDPRQNLKKAHGILNAVGWGIFLPIGVIVARYVRPYFDPQWFYIHISLQTLGYILGTVGWGLGLKLGSYAGKSSAARLHQGVGTSIFVFATLQVVSLVLRPHKEHKIRPYWNIYHHTIGYVTLILIFINIYKGFRLLQPSKTVQNLYTAFLVIVVLTAVSLEAYGWYRYAQNRKKRPTYAVHSPYSDTNI